MRRGIGLAAVLAVALAAASLTGAWKGQFDFNGNPVPLTFELKNDGAALTGSVTGLPAGVAEIKEGKVQGDNISFFVNSTYQGEAIKLVYKGLMQDDGIHFSMGLEDGSWGVEFVAKRGT